MAGWSPTTPPARSRHVRCSRCTRRWHRPTTTCTAASRSASQITTERFESAYDDIARFIGAPSRRSIVVVRNTTEAHQHGDVLADERVP